MSDPNVIQRRFLLDPPVEGRSSRFRLPELPLEIEAPACVPLPAPRLRQTPPRKRIAWWALAAAVLVPCLYLPTLAARFDFIDDGNLVYPAPPMPLVERLGLVWHKIVANYEHLGPFRPVLWAHWEVQADLLGGSALAWRAVRLFWCMLAAGSLLWLMRELRLHSVAILACTALALWNPFRGEIWISLTLAEGVAMPYALLALVCAVRAGRSRRPGWWDVAGALCVLAALGCKNTFAALVPAQMVLRIAADGQPLREGWQRHGRRAVLLALTLLLPLGHFLVFKHYWRPGQYVTGPLSLRQVGNMLDGVAGAVSIGAMAPGLCLAVAALLVNGRQRRRVWPWPHGWEPQGASLGTVWSRHRAACRAGVALLVCGIAIYGSIHGVSGRYTLPAAWGADLIGAALLSELIQVAAVWWRRLAWVALGCGLLAVVVSNLGRQARFAARAEVLWQALEHVERHAPQGACLGWMAGPDLGAEEGIHFCWHLHDRGRRDLSVRLFTAEGRPLQRCELPAQIPPPSFLVSSGAASPGPCGEPSHRFRTFYWAGHRHYDLSLWAIPAKARACGDLPDV